MYSVFDHIILTDYMTARLRFETEDLYLPHFCFVFVLNQLKECRNSTERGERLKHLLSVQVAEQKWSLFQKETKHLECVRCEVTAWNYDNVQLICIN